MFADLNAKGDLALASLHHYDGLGRLWLSQQMEDGSSPACSDTTSGIKTETRYSNSSLGRFRLVSNPYRSTSDATAGWTLTSSDTVGRPVLTGHFSGGAAPAWGNVAPTSGATMISYDLVDGGSPGVYETVSDQQSLRWNFRDGLGRLIEVREKDPGNAFTYSTTYTYDALDNLAGVTQAGLTNGACAGSQSRCFAYDSLRLGSASNPESGTASYIYDDNGNLTQRTQGGVTTAMSYDALNRPFLKTYSGASTPAVTYCYDGQIFGGADGTCSTGSAANGIGHLTQVRTSVSATSYSAFDPLGRIKTSVQSSSGSSQPYSFSYGYNRVGMTSETYPSQRTVNYQYDTAGRVKGLYAGTKNYAGYAADPQAPIQYAPHGGIASMKLGNGLIETMAYNDRLQIQSMNVGTNSNPASAFGMGLYYCPGNAASCSSNNGNILGVSLAIPGVNQVYGYDGAGRLTSMQEDGNSQTWQYDNVGNRWVNANSGFPQSSFMASSAGGYNGKNQLTVQGAQYDPAHGSGNQTQIGNYTFTYDGENRLASSQNGGTTTYSYDGEGRRVRKQNANGTTTYVYDASGNLAAEYSTAAQTGSACAPCYVSADQLGSTRLLTDASGAVVERHDYMPFGDELVAGVGGRTTGQGYPTGATAEATSVLFTGQYRDAENASSAMPSGLDYFGARYFSGAQGRFTSPDKPLVAQIPSNPQSWNLYSYARNNPLKYIDPTGQCSVKTDGGPATDDPEAPCVAPKDSSVTVNGNSDNSTTYFNGLGVQVGYLPYNPAIKNVDYQLFVGLGAARLGLGLLPSATASAEALVYGAYGTVTRAALVAAAGAGGPTIRVVTQLTQSPQAGRALSVAAGEGAEELAAAARSGGTTYVANIPSALIQLMKNAGLVTQSTTQMGSGTATELRFAPNATEFVSKFFNPAQ